MDNGGSIPPNLIAAAHTESNSAYIRYCTDKKLKPHPARFPSEVPEFFIRMLTDINDLVVDPFAGSCVTGEAAERTKRKWICCELRDDYLQGALGRFQTEDSPTAAISEPSYKTAGGQEKDYYRISKPGGFWNGVEGPPLAADGGFKRPPKPEKKQLALMDARDRRTGKGKFGG